MTRGRAKWMDQASFWVVDVAGPPRKLRRPTMASPQPGEMLPLATFHGFIRRMSDQCTRKIEPIKLPPPVVQLTYNCAVSIARCSSDGRAKNTAGEERVGWCAGCNILAALLRPY